LTPRACEVPKLISMRSRGRGRSGQVAFILGEYILLESWA
jgi:hypothetical protein